MIRKNIFKWHRTLSLIIAIPVLLWAISGFMHPLMTTIRPAVVTQTYTPVTIDSCQLKTGLTDALHLNNITAIHNFRIIKMGGNWFYQVQVTNSSIPLYLSTLTGKPLKNGDLLYARFLARYFLEGPEKKTESVPGPTTGPDSHDCCSNTTSAILFPPTGARISSVEYISDFTEEYKYINRLLPAYRVEFSRADGVRIYVETVQDRFAFATDNKRAGFDKFFSLFHTLGWLNFMGKAKHFIEIVIMLLAFLTTLMGIYIFCITKTKETNGNATLKARRNHRWTSIIIALFTLMFTGSGAIHAFEKTRPDNRNAFFTRNRFSAGKLTPDFTKLIALTGTDKQISNISVVKISDKTYWQVFTQNKRPDSKKPLANMDLMKNKTVPVPETLYINVDDYTLLTEGESTYARHLATLFTGQPPVAIKSCIPITRFENEYGFVNKRLPVWKVSYPANYNERFYVETGSGKLAAHVNDLDLIDGYSFALFHKHHFMDFAGKTGRDISTMFWAFAQVVMVAVGIFLYVKMRKRKKK